jgi:hypothetical protein
MAPDGAASGSPDPLTNFEPEDYNYDDDILLKKA